jgi:hypothetical protein
VASVDHIADASVGDNVGGQKEGDSLDTRAQVLVTIAQLADLIQAGDPVTILDVRWRLDQPDGRAEYL